MLGTRGALKSLKTVTDLPQVGSLPLGVKYPWVFNFPRGDTGSYFLTNLAQMPHRPQRFVSVLSIVWCLL